MCGTVMVCSGGGGVWYSDGMCGNGIYSDGMSVCGMVCVTWWTYLCSRRSCRRDDRTIGLLSPLASLNGVRSRVLSFSVKMMSINILMSSRSGMLSPPKQRVVTTSMK